VEQYGPHDRHGIDCATVQEWNAASRSYRKATATIRNAWSPEVQEFSERLNTSLREERDAITTDVVLTIPGDHGLDDAVVMVAIETAQTWIEERLGLDVTVSSHLSNDDGETFHSVKAERDRARAELLRRPNATPAALTAGVDREVLVNALRPVLCNASSYPREVQPRILGRDMGPLLAAAADAVLAFLADQPTPAPVGAAAVERPAHGPDWSDWDFDHPEEWPSCRCGFNGSPEECAAARAGEVQR